MGSREAIAVDATAVLAFDDGTRIPCDRFIMRSFCGVIKRLLEDSTCDTDDQGRTVIPVPCQTAEPYWIAVDLLHGVTGTWTLDLSDTLGTIACMEYLGVAVHDAHLDARLWQLIKDDSLEALLPHVPRLLRNVGLAALVIRRLIALRPLWSQFLDDVLVPLQRDIDRLVIAAMMAYAPNFFPPVLVLDWAVSCAYALSMEDVLRIASLHGVLLHPAEAPVVLRKVAEHAECLPNWALVAGFLKNAASIMDTYEALPWSANRAHGSMIKFHDVPHCGVCLSLEGRLPSVIKATPWLTVACRGGFDLTFRPRGIDDSAHTCESLQLRVMVFDRRDPCKGRCAEAWYLFEGVGAEVCALADARTTKGQPADVARMMPYARVLRLDFFFGKYSVFENPFDPSSAAKGTVTLLNVSQGQ